MKHNTHVTTQKHHFARKTCQILQQGKINNEPLTSCHPNLAMQKICQFLLKLQVANLAFLSQNHPGVSLQFNKICNCAMENSHLTIRKVKSTCYHKEQNQGGLGGSRLQRFISKIRLSFPSSERLIYPNSRTSCRFDLRNVPKLP